MFSLIRSGLARGGRSHAAQAAQDCFEELRIFFPEELAELADDLFNVMQNAHLDYSLTQMEGVKDTTEKWVKAEEAMREQAPKLQNHLAAKFHELLGSWSKDEDTPAK